MFGNLLHPTRKTKQIKIQATITSFVCVVQDSFRFCMFINALTVINNTDVTNTFMLSFGSIIGLFTVWSYIYNIRRYCNKIINLCSNYDYKQIFCFLLSVLGFAVLVPLYFLFVFMILPITSLNFGFYLDYTQKFDVWSRNPLNESLLKYIINNKLNKRARHRRLIALNYYIISSLQPEIEAIAKDRNTLYDHKKMVNTIASLHNSNDLMNSRWRDIYRQSKSSKRQYNSKFIRIFRMVSGIISWICLMSIYLSCIGLLIYTYFIANNDTNYFIMIIFLLFESLFIILIYYHIRFWINTYRIIPNIKKNYLLWNNYDLTKEEMIANIDSVYNIMFVETKTVKAVYECTVFHVDINRIIADYLWYSLPNDGDGINDITQRYQQFQHATHITNKFNFMIGNTDSYINLCTDQDE